MKSVNLNWRIFVSMFICLLLIIPLASCKSYAEYGDDWDYEYSDYKFDSEKSQFYMAENTAAAENGYYYISNAPVNDVNYDFIYFYDMKNQTSLPLCSKLNCEHGDENCDAYISENKCVENNIWYYKGRLYMIERTGEKDLLVSYDKNGRDKKTQAELSVDGCTVREGAKVTGGRLYYYVSDGDRFRVYAASLTKKEPPKHIKNYEFSYSYAVGLDIYAVNDGIYIRFFGSDSIGDEEYVYDYYDAKLGEIKNRFDSTSDSIDIRGKVAFRGQHSDIYYESNSVYFVSIDENEFIVNRLNFDTKKCDEFFVVDTLKHNNDTWSTNLEGYDGKYLYIYEGIDPESEAAKPGEVQGNYLYVIDMDGTLVDTLHFDINRQFAKENGMSSRMNGIGFNTFCGDDRYIFVTLNKGTVTGLELSDKWIEKYNSINGDANITKKSAAISAVGVIDKKQIGTGSFNWINVTSK